MVHNIEYPELDTSFLCQVRGLHFKNVKNSPKLFDSDITAVKDCILSNLKTRELKEVTVLFHNNFSS